uniref:NADP-dependent oxidoreductase domain-containing protein n=1 Tax=Anopheles dirus TaxID=7168 RepID=A0A182N8T9_9DIPT
MIPTALMKISEKQSIRLPVIGLGTYSLTGTEGKESIKTAIDSGYRMFDTAVAYGNERIVGEAIGEKIREGNGLTREDFFVISKLSGSYHRLDRVEQCCRMSVDRLGLDYVDLYLMHTPVAQVDGGDGSKKAVLSNAIDDTVDPLEAWFGLEKCYRAGICRAIGVSNFSEQQLNALPAEGTIAPAVNQIECSVGFNQQSMREFCRQQDILVMGYAPLGKQKLPFLSAERVKQIALAVGKSPAQVCLRYLIEKGVVPVVKSANHTRQQENLNIFDFKLTAEQLAQLDGIGGNE